MRIEGAVITKQQNNLSPLIKKEINHTKIIIDSKQDNLSQGTTETFCQETDLIKYVEEANKNIIIYDRKFEFEVHEHTNKIMVRVIDAKTDEMIKEIPPEKRLDLLDKLWELSGIFVDEIV